MIWVKIKETKVWKEEVIEVREQGEVLLLLAESNVDLLLIGWEGRVRHWG